MSQYVTLIIKKIGYYHIKKFKNLSKSIKMFNYNWYILFHNLNYEYAAIIYIILLIFLYIFVLVSFVYKKFSNM